MNKCAECAKRSCTYAYESKVVRGVQVLVCLCMHAWRTHIDIQLEVKAHRAQCLLTSIAGPSPTTKQYAKALSGHSASSAAQSMQKPRIFSNSFLSLIGQSC